MSRIIDCHCHIYPDAIAERAVAGTSGFYDLPSVYNGKVSQLYELGSKLGVDHYVVFSVATTPHQTESINEFIAKAVAESRGAMTGLGTVHPDSQTLEKDIDHLQQLDLRGVKLHADIQAIAADDPRCMKIYAICQERGLPMLLHTGDHRFNYSNPKRIAHVLESFPNLTVVGAHLGGWSVWDEAEHILPGHPNFYVDCSSSMYALSPEKTLEIIRTYGAERVLYGTDFPMWPMEKEIQRFFDLALTKEEQELILHKNAEKLFGIPKKD
ncbi:MAG: amidohydrolase [Oscillospiraceae bacterium]|nr:amidohydrolase [Oscillospiraceae bacterium]